VRHAARAASSSASGSRPSSGETAIPQLDAIVRAASVDRERPRERLLDAARDPDRVLGAREAREEDAEFLAADPGHADLAHPGLEVRDRVAVADALPHPLREREDRVLAGARLRGEARHAADLELDREDGDRFARRLRRGQRLGDPLDHPLAVRQPRQAVAVGDPLRPLLAGADTD
jgi:hypothetical protein